MKLALGLVLALAAGSEDEGVSIRLTVSNFYKTADGMFWSSGAWELSQDQSAGKVRVRVTLEPQRKGAPRRDLTGTVDAEGFGKAFADLKKKGLFSAGNSRACLCDAPQFRMAAREKKQEHRFRFEHAHAHDADQKALVDGFIALVEKHATEAAKEK
jgi:hypothetical protein